MFTYTKRFSFVWVLVLAIVLLCSACAGGSTTSTGTHTHTATLPTLPTATAQHFTGPITYVALGASDAVGVGSTQLGSQGYVPLLAEKLPKGSHLVNLGISGIHLHQALQEELPLALSTSPSLVTIWLVANDFVAGVAYDTYMQDLDTLLQQLHSNTHARLVMANLPDLTRLPVFSHRTSEQKAQMLTEIQRWNAGSASRAGHYGVTLADLFSHNSQLTAHPEYISGDGFHPSASGYVQLANIFWQAIYG